MQFAREGIRVNALCPGPVNTPLLQELFAKDAERAPAPPGPRADRAASKKTEEIAAAITFLGQRRTPWFIAPATFLVDGASPALT